MQDNKAEHTADTRAVCQLPEDNTTENPGGSLVLPHHTTRSRGGSDAVWGQVIHIAADLPAPAADP